MLGAATGEAALVPAYQHGAGRIGARAGMRLPPQARAGARFGRRSSCGSAAAAAATSWGRSIVFFLRNELYSSVRAAGRTPLHPAHPRLHRRVQSRAGRPRRLQRRSAPVQSQNASQFARSAIARSLSASENAGIRCRRTALSPPAHARPLLLLCGRSLQRVPAVTRRGCTPNAPGGMDIACTTLALADQPMVRARRSGHAPRSAHRPTSG